MRHQANLPEKEITIDTERWVKVFPPRVRGLLPRNPNQRDVAKMTIEFMVSVAVGIVIASTLNELAGVLVGGIGITHGYVKYSDSVWKRMSKKKDGNDANNQSK
jgi:hypothetical protein